MSSQVRDTEEEKKNGIFSTGNLWLKIINFKSMFRSITVKDGSKIAASHADIY